MSAPVEAGASGAMVILGSLLIVAAYLTDRPVSTALAVAGLLVLVPEVLRGWRAWRKPREASR